jgi:hypothetical protein
MRLLLIGTLLGALAACGGGSSGNPVHDLSTTSPDLSMPGSMNDLTMSMATDDSGTVGVADMTICSKVSTLHPPTKNELFCPFGGDAGHCASGSQHCCEPAMGTSTCDPLATPCPAGQTDWQCEDPADCAMGMVCCGSGTLVKSPDPNCGNYATGFHATHCAATCMANEIKMCTSTGECSNGLTCVPFRTKGNQVGGCG